MSYSLFDLHSDGAREVGAVDIVCGTPANEREGPQEDEGDAIDAVELTVDG